MATSYNSRHTATLRFAQTTLWVASYVRKTLPEEREAIIHLKRYEPYLSHRQISGFIRVHGFFVSPSSCYRVLKSLS